MKKIVLLMLSVMLLASCDTAVNKAAITGVQQDVTDPQYGKGMLINVTYQLAGKLEPNYKCAVQFADADGNPLIDNNNQFASTNGIVTCGCEFSPSENMGSVSVFMPYDELHIPLKRPIELQVGAGIFNSFLEEIVRTDCSNITIK